MSLTLISCNEDRCDDGYKPYNSSGHEICIPEYINGLNHNFELGNQYIHPEFGLITLENGTWKNENNMTITIQ
ncbi:hypothetical protein [Tenacibaculum sediminilitoris]|uniref:hypothetical protein n=1 Tax=Tenacibaculum sediminilitoris TaxID=1820334 RepID=UPI0038B41C88